MPIAPLGPVAPTPNAAPPERMLPSAGPPTSSNIDRIEREPPAVTELPLHGFGVGVIAGASAEAGVVIGGATVSIGAGLFADRGGVHPGAFADAGSFAGAVRTADDRRMPTVRSTRWEPMSVPA